MSESARVGSPITVPGYASDPTIEVIWGPAPAVTGNIGNASGSGAAPNVHEAVSVAIASLTGTENSMLALCRALCATYNPLEQTVLQEINGGTFFGQDAMMIAPNPNAPISQSNHDITPQNVWVPDTQLQQSAVTFAAQINPNMTRVLRAVADGVESLGVYIALLDKAAQAYAYADKNSAAPPAPASTSG